MTLPVITARDSTWVATQAMAMIGATSVDNPPSADDLTLAVNRLNDVADDLRLRGVIYLADLDNIPAGVALHVARALALAIQPDFGNSAPPGSAAVPPQDVTEAALRRITAQDVSYGPQRMSFF